MDSEELQAGEAAKGERGERPKGGTGHIDADESPANVVIHEA